jgi:hypothetical protein
MILVYLLQVIDNYRVREEIITALSRIRWLFVIARNSSFTYKGQSGVSWASAMCLKGQYAKPEAECVSPPS